MNIELLNSPQTAIAKVILEANEELVAQNGSLIAMSPDMTVQSSVRRSGDGGGKQSSRGAQAKTIFLNNYRAGENGGAIYLAPALVGKLGHYQLEGRKLIVRQSSYLASASQVDIFMGYKSTVKKEPYSWLSLVGTGDILISAFGAMYTLEVDGKQIVNSDHVVAFDNSLKVKQYEELRPWPRRLVPIQEILYEFSGTGAIICQSHGPQGLAQEVGRQLKPENFKLR
ncbi:MULTISPECIES: AIM24 family protein [unclassified Synechocystis]|uniref:AIM24 family protein n=1 Tax=unclassified Synechocystis TaxID=2640012 RepID=UPI000406120A|nr:MULTISPECIES: AIM24 family protein [unclassified Synechocystis]AIE76021.1 DUF124 domain-containing protein [Synechocystis sp. PCC 6714]MCT0255073.1 AIM24 family protein [Synechocystis sp. CS-94]